MVLAKRVYLLTVPVLVAEISSLLVTLDGTPIGDPTVNGSPKTRARKTCSSYRIDQP